MCVYTYIYIYRQAHSTPVDMHYAGFVTRPIGMGRFWGMAQRRTLCFDFSVRGACKCLATPAAARALAVVLQSTP